MKAFESRILVLAPTGKDGLLTCQLLDSAGFKGECCCDCQDLLHKLESGAGVLLITEESLTPTFITDLSEFLRKQPLWSDVPIIFSALPTRSGKFSAKAQKFCQDFSNIIGLKRPIQMKELLNSVQRALTERLRQYQMRNVHNLEVRGRKQAQLASRRRDEFLATLSHELRSPLNAVMGFSELLAEKSLEGEEASQAAATILRNSKVQLDLIDELLEVSRIDSGKIHLKKHPLDIFELTHRVIESFQATARAKGIELCYYCDQNIFSAFVEGDSTRLQQVIWNLIGNSLKFTPCGGRIAITTTVDNKHYHFTIEDTGCGIAPSFLPYIFHRYRQEENPHVRRMGGMGIGMFLVKSLVELHGGHIEAFSEGPGRGAKFIFSLPITSPCSQLSTDSAPSPGLPNSDNKAQQQLAVLVVDDQEDSRRLVYSSLRNIYQVVTAQSASQARELLSHHKFDAILCDIQMPEEDGLTFVSQLRARSDLQEMPIVALSGHQRPEEIGKILAAGFSQHFAKPIRPSALRVALRELFEKNHSKRYGYSQ